MNDGERPSEALGRAHTPDDVTAVLGDALDDMAARVDELERRLAEIEAARAADPPKS